MRAFNVDEIEGWLPQNNGVPHTLTPYFVNLQIVAFTVKNIDTIFFA